MIWSLNEKWKTSFCCPSDGDCGDGDGDADGGSMILWVLSPDEEDEERQEAAVICFCREEELEILSLP